MHTIVRSEGAATYQPASALGHLLPRWLRVSFQIRQTQRLKNSMHALRANDDLDGRGAKHTLGSDTHPSRPRSA